MAPGRLVSSLLFAASLLGVRAQQTTPFTDDTTGITFQQFTPANTAGFSFGIALPEDSSSTDFIGRISASTTGWGAVTLTGSMRNAVLVVAWPNGDNVGASLRIATGYSNPTALGGDAVLKPIQEGTSVNSTSFTYTFLCQGCIVDGKAFDPTAESAVLGWALSSTPVTTPSSVSTTLQYHDGGFGGFGLAPASAQSAEFASWAALASAGGDNSTVPIPPTNDTSPVTPPSNATIPVSNSTYDYIVVGGGASGLVVSERLAETGKSVLVLERGGPSFYSSGGDVLVPWNDTLTPYEVPGLFTALSSFPGVNAYCPDVPEVAGCILGGGTAVNGLQFVRPPSSDFAAWPAGWNWADIEAAATRAYERNPGSTMPSTDGKWYDDAVYQVMSKLLDGAGWTYADNNDEPDAKFKSYSRPAINTVGGLRAGPVRTYLPLAMGLPNFKLQMHTKVIRAVRTNSTITGVEVEDSQGQRQIINVNRGGRVILAAGAMSSPRILFNSGIGPAEQINIVKSSSTGVTLPPESAWINSPVGHVRDHSLLNVAFKVNTGMDVMDAAEFTSPSNQTLSLFAHGAGPLAQSFNRMMSYTEVTSADGHMTRVQTHYSAYADDTITMLFGITHGVTSRGMLGISPEGNTYWTTSPYLQTESDKAALAAAIDEVLAISRKPNSTITYAGSANATGASIIQDNLSSLIAGAHMTGTTIMGAANGSAVVDTDCKVFGTDNLFVVDAGMHADVPTGNTMAIVMVAAEHAAAKIIALDGLSANGTATTPPSSGSTGALTPAPIASGYPVASASAAPSRSPAPYKARPVRGGTGKAWWAL